MRLPKMTAAELAVFAACFAVDMERRSSRNPSVDNANAEEALESALWSLECFRQALRERKR